MDVTFRSDMKVELIDFMGGDGRTVQAARTSTLGAADSQPEEKAGLINFLWRDGHHVPFEHSLFTFRIECPIFVSRQLVKYRTTAISEESGRYRVLDHEFYVPDQNRKLGQIGKTGDYNMVHLDYVSSRTARERIEDASQDAALHYSDLLRMGVAKEVARMVLPVNVYTSMYLTINARNLIHLLNQRDEKHAQHEIQDVAQQMRRLLAERMPLAWQAWQRSKAFDTALDRIKKAHDEYVDPDNDIDTREFAQKVEDILDTLP